MKNKNKAYILDNIKIRQINIKDYNQIVQLQLKCFPTMKPWKKEQIESQVSIFPEGQLCIELNKKVIASSSSLIVDIEIYDQEHKWFDISDHGFITNHNSAGDTLYGIEIMVDPEYQGNGLARKIYNARKELAIQYNLRRIVLGGRIPGFTNFKDKLTPQEYIDQVTQKKVFDPVLSVQIANGFVLKRIIDKYLEMDEDSAGFATFLEWTNLNYQPKQTKQYYSSNPVRICSVQYQMRRIKSFGKFSQQVKYFIDVASDYKCDFVLFPELFTTQLLSFLKEKDPQNAAKELAEFTPQFIELFKQLAVSYNVNIIAGSHFIIEDHHLYNVAYLFHRNGEIDKQYKLHITPSEKKYWGVEHGNKIEVFDTDKCKIAIQVCYDVEFPEISRIAVEKGARIIFVPFCTDNRNGYLRVRYCAQARCVENQVYVAIAGNVGNLPDVVNMDIQYAQSAIFTPSDLFFARDGIAAEATANVESVVIHDVDIEALNRHKGATATHNWDDRRTDLYNIVYQG
ncbi:MAG: GNAT family N-acetyltransferase [Bacteroidota bacterium]